MTDQYDAIMGGFTYQCGHCGSHLMFEVRDANSVNFTDAADRWCVAYCKSEHCPRVDVRLKLPLQTIQCDIIATTKGATDA